MQTSAEVVKMDETWKIVVLIVELLILVGEIVLYVVTIRRASKK